MLDFTGHWVYHPIYPENNYSSFFLLIGVLGKGNKLNISLLQGLSGMKNRFTMRNKSKSQTFSVIHGGQVSKSRKVNFPCRVLNDYNLANRRYSNYNNQNVINYTLCKASRCFRTWISLNFFKEGMQRQVIGFFWWKSVSKSMMHLHYSALLRKHSKAMRRGLTHTCCGSYMCEYLSRTLH